MADVWDRVDTDIDCSQRTEALVLMRWAQRFLQDEDPQTAVALFRRAKTILGKNDPWLWAAEFGESVALAASADFHTAAERLPEVRDMLDRRGEAVLACKVSWWLGTALMQIGHLDQALSILKETVDRQISLGDDRGAAWSAYRVAEALVQTGEVHEARQVLDAAVDSFAALGDENGAALAAELIEHIEGAEQSDHANG